MPGYELISEEERNQVLEIFEKSNILVRQGFDNNRNNIYKVRDFENEFSNYLGSSNALAVTSGTAALRVALAAANIGKNDEVITQSFTFVATVEAIIESGAKPICTNIERNLNMDPNDLLKKITPNTKAVIVVHMLGIPARLDEIKKICDANNLILIEDTAWGCGGKYKDKYLGTWGDIGTFSFDFAKTITTGEGGMVVFKNDQLYKKAAAWHDHGHENNPLLPRWEDSRSGSGFNFRMMEVQGAIGLAQLKKLDFIVSKQRENYFKIWNAIKDIDFIELREVPNNSYETCDALVFFTPSKRCALNCRDRLISKGLGTKILPEAFTWHYSLTWDHMKELNVNEEMAIDLKESTNLLSRSVSLPILVNMNDDVPQLVYEALISVDS